MPLAPQEARTFFVSSVTDERKPIFRMVRFCALLLDLMREDRALKRYELREFVFMSNHIHLVLTPAPNVSLEKAMQFCERRILVPHQRRRGLRAACRVHLDESREGWAGPAAGTIFVLIGATKK
jgi:REP element-mobilizing transposase RayT